MVGSGVVETDVDLDGGDDLIVACAGSKSCRWVVDWRVGV
jgi:hypothetical protein